MLQISGLSKTYPGGTHALRKIDLTIGNGLFGLLGPNGAGKSTLMRMIATLQDPDEGTITFHGHDVFRESDRLRAQLGYLPQDFGVYPGVSAARLLDHLAVLKGLLDAKERARQVEALLQLTNLHAVRKQSVSTFSGGMKQRFGLAQALLGRPRLIVVDEPTAGLDPEERNRILNLLSEVGENVVVILSTHIVDDVRNLCSRMAILHAGRIGLEGRPSALVEDLRGRVWTKTVPKDAVASYRSRHTVLSTHLFAGQTRIRAVADEPPDPGFEAAEPDLEDVYFAFLAPHRNPGEVRPC